MSDNEDVEAGEPGEAAASDAVAPDPEEQVRLGCGPGGPRHRRVENEQQVKDTREAIARAIESLVPIEGKRGYPSGDRIWEAGGGEFGRSRIFEHLDLVHAAVDAWNEREKLAGRKTRPRKGKDEQAFGVPEERFKRSQAQLKRAHDEIDDLRKRNGRLSGRNADLERQVERLAKGVYDEVWPPKAKPAADPTSRQPDEADVTPPSTMH